MAESDLLAGLRALEQQWRQQIESGDDPFEDEWTFGADWALKRCAEDLAALRHQFEQSEPVAD